MGGSKFLGLFSDVVVVSLPLSLICGQFHTGFSGHGDLFYRICHLWYIQKKSLNAKTHTMASNHTYTTKLKSVDIHVESNPLKISALDPKLSSHH